MKLFENEYRMLTEWVASKSTEVLSLAQFVLNIYQAVRIRIEVQLVGKDGSLTDLPAFAKEYLRTKYLDIPMAKIQSIIDELKVKMDGGTK
jgi:hypothetical protein